MSHRLVGTPGEIVGIDEFGLSAPAGQALEARGMTVDRVLVAARKLAS